MTIKPLPLSFDWCDLEPFLSKEALKQHYDMHYLSCLDRLNCAIRGSRYADMSLREIIMASEGPVYQEAAQSWNHAFYWQCLSSTQPDDPTDDLLRALEVNFGSINGFKREFESQSCASLGSGWVWLVKSSSGDLSIINTQNADTPILDINTVPLLVIDLWEHAYYKDYEHRRQQYVNQFWTVVNWRFVERNFMETSMC